MLLPCHAIEIRAVCPGALHGCLQTLQPYVPASVCCWSIAAVACTGTGFSTPACLDRRQPAHDLLLVLVEMEEEGSRQAEAEGSTGDTYVQVGSLCIQCKVVV
jgi:hypothetical protein